MEEVSFVPHDNDGSPGIWVDLAYVLVERSDWLVAAVVCDGVDQEEALCPFHTPGQGVQHLHAVFLHLWYNSEHKFAIGSQKYKACIIASTIKQV